MRKSIGVSVLLFAAYSVPYAYLAVAGDALWGTMSLFGVMGVALTVLSVISIRQQRMCVMIFGNAMSLLASIAVAWWTKTDAMGAYFKPFTFHSWMRIIFGVAFGIQLAAHLIAKWYSTRNT